ncbi:aromatic ring-hydroxylating oxygenase subunit alpha [Lichenihabitans psoromatis]|uniref:aromatic ring-hydroxylating oxygenase subunit alpha n=1 Tax=Lichenihabitans psoromatis TaxID=2528642 RepID=UPI001FE0C7FB|nr:aromatic ring-hydroxylating dioxygenase subunit alpha [Lichenihabitans psoromatis]
MMIVKNAEQSLAEPAALDQWYVIDNSAAVTTEPRRTRLLGIDIVLRRDAWGAPIVEAADRAGPLPVHERYDCVWTTLGTPPRDIPAIPEAGEPDRRHVVCGAVAVRASGLRIVENFLDMAHFPFVHTDILGAEPNTEVLHYTTEIRRDIDEVWATNCQFFQPQAAVASTGGIMTQYQYRVATPFVTMLYKTCPNADDRWDVICLFVQPLDPGHCRAHAVMFLIDETSPLNTLVQFQQMIFLQDRIILENQRPILLPLEPRSEIPTRADGSSIAYRRWLKEKCIVYGTTAGPTVQSA